MESGLEIPITWLLFGATLAGIGLTQLGEYRHIVSSKSRLAMSIKVFLHAVLRPMATKEHFGTPLLILSAWFFIAGLLGLAAWLGGILAGPVKT